ncbi:MAG: hypothetical protein ACYCSN_06100 [Acidobacteriaceae bacterium]
MESRKWLVWIALIALIYYPTFHTFPFFDDTAHVEWVIAYGSSFLHHPESPMFRPFERLIIGLSWKMPWNGFWLAKTFSLAILFCKAFLVAALTRMVLRGRYPLLGFAVPILFLVHPMHVEAVIKIDTISENLSSFFGLALVLLAGKLALTPDEELSPGHVAKFAAGAATLSLLGMLSKEAFLGMAVAAPLLLGVASWRSRDASKARFASLLGTGLSFLAMAGYFLLRRAAGYALTGGSQASGRYQFHLGLNVLLNAATSIGASLFPGSTLRIFVHFDLFYVLLTLALVLAAVLLHIRSYIDFFHRIWAGHARTVGEIRVLLLFVIAVVASLVPGGMINGLISENQGEETIAFVIMLVIFIPIYGTEPRSHSLGGARSTATIALFAVMGAYMATAASQKVAAAHEMSRRAYAMGDEMMRDYLAHPVGHYFLCIPPGSMQGRYSIFHVSDGMLAAMQMYRINLLHPPKPPNFIPDLPAYRTLCSMRVSDQKLYPQIPTSVEAR